MEGKKKTSMMTNVSTVDHLTEIYHDLLNEEDNEHVTDYENLNGRF